METHNNTKRVSLIFEKVNIFSKKSMMNKIEYFKLNYSLDKDEIGDIYNKELNLQIENFIDPENNSSTRFKSYRVFSSSHIDSNLDLNKFEVNEKSEMTDLLSSSFFPDGGYFVSKRFVDLIKECNLEEGEFFNCVVTKKKKKYDYCILSLLSTINNFDFSKSKFAIINDTKLNLDVISEIKLNTLEEFNDKAGEIYFETHGEHKLIPLKLTLNKRMDLFKSGLDHETYVSKRLKDKIETMGLTGFDFERSKVDIEFYEDF